MQLTREQIEAITNKLRQQRDDAYNKGLKALKKSPAIQAELKEWKKLINEANDAVDRVPKKLTDTFGWGRQQHFVTFISGCRPINDEWLLGLICKGKEPERIDKPDWNDVVLATIEAKDMVELQKKLGIKLS